MPIYILIGGMACAGLLLLWLTGFAVSPSILVYIIRWPVPAIAAGMCLRRLGVARFGGAMEATGILYGQALASFLCLVPLAAISAPLVDSSLARFDRSLGFDWISYAKMTAPLRPLFWAAYKSFMWQPVLVASVLFVARQERRAWALVLAATIALALTAAIFPFAPAEGSMLYFHVNIPSPAPPFARALISLKHGARVLDRSTFAGLVSFPSYHAAAAVIFAWGCWRTALRWPFLLLNLIMAASAITLGAHYLTDILAGAAVGAASISLALWSHRDRDLL